jgi:hypothetical protein
MFTIFTARYWAQRAANKRARERRRGWDWAAGELLHGTDEGVIVRFVEQAQQVGMDTDFDKGVLEAVKVWNEQIPTAG